jgi:hypothetical protein
MDRQGIEGVDVVHDWYDLPWPFEDGEVEVLRASHVLEHICPMRLLEFMDEAWRALKVGGEFHISLPPAFSAGDAQDPTHCAHFTAATWTYFDPDCAYYDIYKPKPWRIKKRTKGPDVVLIKRAE